MFTAAKLYSVELTRWSDALAFAIDAHGQQKRKYTGDPYWWHVAQVASTVSHVPDRSIEMIEAALLHDTLEDTAVTETIIRAKFGESVTSYVKMLTDPPLEYGNREKRKTYIVDRLRHESWQVKTIKLADLIDNTSSIVTHDPNFAVVYLKEKAALLEVLRGGDQALWDRAWRSLEDATRALENAKLGEAK